ncbi:MAG: hypothetical protein V4466_18050 [Pseudomonadota bacterium]
MILATLSLLLALCQDGPISTALPPPPASSAMATPALVTPAPTYDVGDFLEPPEPTRTPAQPSLADHLRIDPPSGADQAEAASAEPAAGGAMHCRRTDNGFVCGSNEDDMQKTEDLLGTMFPKN